MIHRYSTPGRIDMASNSQTGEFTAEIGKGMLFPIEISVDPNACQKKKISFLETLAHELTHAYLTVVEGYKPKDAKKHGGQFKKIMEQLTKELRKVEADKKLIKKLEEERKREDESIKRHD